MNEPSEITASELTQWVMQAARLPADERDAFLRDRCAGGPDALGRAQQMLAEFLAVEATNDGLLHSAAPLATIDPFATQDFTASSAEAGSAPDPDRTQDFSNSSEQDTGEWEPDLFATLPGEAQARIEEIGRRFTAEWLAGKTPQLVEFVPEDGDAAMRECVVSHLLAIDISQRRQRNNAISVERYLSELPSYAATVRLVVTKQTSSAPGRQVFSGQRDAGGVRGSAVEDGGENSIRYRVVKLHAQGGLGAVYKARDAELGRTVALKRILPQHQGNQGSKARFVLEAEITGALEHPGIVPVYGLGKYHDGSPYYAMRFIEGRSFGAAIKSFHKAHPEPSRDMFLDREFRQLLKRLIDSCNAMHYAHRQGILHRDLKPDNVMLGQYGETLVVDWGLAKRLRSLAQPPDPEHDVATTTTLVDATPASHTTFGTAVGTPMYMSPEQAMGLHDQLTPASDVYSLGAMLFQIICGQYPIEGRDSRKVITAVREGRIRNLRDVAPTAPAALVSICKKAMHVSADKRYPSGLALADDLDRWMNDDAVEAHADHETWLERAGRIIRRYRSWTVSAAVALLAISVISLLSAAIVMRAKQKEAVARQRADEFKSEAVARYRDSRAAIDTWLVQSSDTMQHVPGARSIRNRLLSLAVEDYAKLAATSSEDPELELERGRALVRLGDLVQTQQDFPAAIKHYRDAIELLDRDRTALLDEVDQYPLLPELYSAEVAHARAQLALALASLDDFAQAEQEYLVAIRQLNSLEKVADQPAVIGYLAAAQANFGELTLRRNRFDTAEQALQDALETLSRRGADMEPEDHLKIARIDELMGRMQSLQGNYESAIVSFHAGIERLEPLLATASEVHAYVDALASLEISQASVYRAWGHPQPQLESLRRAAERYRQLHQAVPDLPMYLENLSLTLSDVGLSLFELDRCDEAIAAFDASRQHWATLINNYGNQTRYREHLAANQDGAGQVLLTLGEHVRAEQSFAQAITIYQDLWQNHPDRPEYFERLAVAQSHYGQLLASSHRGADAEDAVAADAEMAQQAFASAASALQDLVELFPNIPRYQNSLAHVYYHQGLFQSAQGSAAARQSFQQARDTWQGLGETLDAAASERLAWLLVSCPDQEIRDLTAAVKFASQANASATANRQFRSTLALAQLAANDLPAAAKTIGEMRQANPMLVGREWMTMALWLHRQGDQQASQQALADGLAWYEQHAPEHPELGLLEAMVRQLSAKRPS